MKLITVLPEEKVSLISTPCPLWSARLDCLKDYKPNSHSMQGQPSPWIGLQVGLAPRPSLGLHSVKLSPQSVERGDKATALPPNELIFPYVGLQLQVLSKSL